MIFKNKIILTSILVISIFLVGCSTDQSITSSDTKYLMGTSVQIRAHGPKAEQLLEKSFDIISDIEYKMSMNIEGSDINRLNQAAGKEGVSVSDETYYVVKEAIEYARLTEGAFDPTVGPLVRLWGINTDEARVPSQEEIDETLELIGYNKVEFNDENNEIFLTKEGMKIDVGGIAKGYAADKAVEFLRDNGIKSAYVNMGGGVTTLGAREDDNPWRVGIQDPREPRGEVLAIVNLMDMSVDTSGDYERYFIEDGVRYHHILDTNTGYPSDMGIISSTIVTPKGLKADSLSTAIYNLGLEEGMRLIEEIEGVEGIIVTDDNKVYISSNLEEEVNLVKEEKYQLQ
ncbi:FAD:protein FMN transferase [Halonatronum saccharophilum]|uniref:FAD:protein FMN transferase n=1 Tax=Halonatronum saccharophilum TaxID=150060 RepID=UPI0004894012|nr:FAD:protein FMN transferase [Halonatronum saccharophilum]